MKLLILIIAVLTCFAASGQFSLIESYPFVATDVYHDGDDRYVTIKDGRLFKNGILYETYPTNVTGERGLLSVCVFDHQLVVNVTSKEGRYQNVLVDGNLLFQVDYLNEPETNPPYARNHRGGDLVAYEDQLFISFGMGTFGTTSQDPLDYRGKIVQIYPLEYIVISGLRNPWRFDYDGINFWIADVGEDLREEITKVENFGTLNLGWPCKEGSYTHNDTCGTTIGPTYEYNHNGQASITGGAYYNGGYYFCDHYSGDGGKLYGKDDLEVIEFPQGAVSMDIAHDTLYVLTWLGDLWGMSLTTTKVEYPEYVAPVDDSRLFDLLGRQINSYPNTLTHKKRIYGIPY